MAGYARYDQNNRATLIATSNDGLYTPVELWADPTTHALVMSGGSSSSVTQYTQGGATVANPVGNSLIWFDNTNTPNATSLSQPFPIGITDGYAEANVLKSDGTVVGRNSQFVAGTYLSVSFTTTGVAALGTTDAGNYRWVSVQFTSQGVSASNTFQVSNDNVNWVNAALQITTSTTGVASSLGNAVAMYAGSLSGRYFRINATAIASGTTAGVIVFSTLPTSQNASGVSAAQSGAWTVGSNSATGSAYPANAFGIGSKALTASPTAATTGNLVANTSNAMGESLVTTGGLVTTAVPANASNVVVKASAGRLARVLVTTTGANPMQIFDNATTNSGTLIGALPASPAVGSVYDFSMPAAAGITIAGSATNPAVTVSWI